LRGSFVRQANLSESRSVPGFSAGAGESATLPLALTDADQVLHDRYDKVTLPVVRCNEALPALCCDKKGAIKKGAIVVPFAPEAISPADLGLFASG
jgi:hypothetical protein